MAEYDDYVKQLDAIQKIAPDGSEYWMARDLQPILGYSEWRNFADVISRAMAACEAAGVPVDNQFAATTKMVNVGSGARRQTDDWFLSRYACYIIAMTADGAKEEVAYAKTYFAIQTRRQEQDEQRSALEQRFQLREYLTDANRGLVKTAHEAGVRRFGTFQDAGYKGLYGGLGAAQIKEHKGIDTKDDLLDCIGHVELAANYFRATQAQQKIQRTGVSTEKEAIDTRYSVAKEVREAMESISGVRPEDLPREESLKRLPKPKTTKQVGG